MHSRALATLVSFLLSLASCHAEDNVILGTQPTLTLTLKAVFPDGSPAAGATAHWDSHYRTVARSAVGDDSGRIIVEDQFTSNVRLRVVSADEHHQAAFHTPDGVSARSISLRGPMRLELRPAVAQRIDVTANGRPVSDSTGVVGYGYTSYSGTGSDGSAIVWCPSELKRGGAFALHPEYSFAKTLDWMRRLTPLNACHWVRPCLIPFVL